LQRAFGLTVGLPAIELPPAPSPPDMAIPAILAADLDDPTTAYAIAMRMPFDNLRQAAAQLAGILLLAAAKSRTATPDHPMLALATQTYHEALDAIRTAVATPRGRHHHRHLTGAAFWIGRALASARSGSGPSATLEVETTLLLLRRGWQELQWAVGALPGFELVAFDQACCAHHGRRDAAGSDH
jgi:hypothetical protein